MLYDLCDSHVPEVTQNYALAINVAVKFLA
jgi:hypothetical protein